MSETILDLDFETYIKMRAEPLDDRNVRKPSGGPLMFGSSVDVAWAVAERLRLMNEENASG